MPASSALDSPAESSLTNLQGSLYCEQDTLAVAARMMPQDAYVRLAQGVFSFLNDWMMSLLTDDAVPAYNMYGLFRLADDLASIQALADATQPPALAVRTSSPHLHFLTAVLLSLNSVMSWGPTSPDRQRSVLTHACMSVIAHQHASPIRTQTSIA